MALSKSVSELSNKAVPASADRLYISTADATPLDRYSTVAQLLATITGLTVAQGGTGNSTFTPYSIIAAGTTATGAFQNVSGVGTAGQLLTSNGAGTLPTWQAAPAAGWALNGNTVGSEKWIGTIDNFNFPIRTNNILRATFDTTGDLDLETFTDATHSIAKFSIAGNNVAGFGGGGNTGNIACGSLALGRVNENLECVAIGYQACYGNVALTGLTGVGYRALTAMTGTYSTGVGHQAGLAATGQYLVLVGANAGVNLTTGFNNTFIGTGTGQGVTTGNYNTIVGGISVAHAAGLSNTVALYTGLNTDQPAFYATMAGTTAASTVNLYAHLVLAEDIAFTTKVINTTAGDSATINSPAGRFRKDTSGSVFTLTNSYVTANSIILVTYASDPTLASQLVVGAGAGSFTVTFSAVPLANTDINFIVIN